MKVCVYARVSTDKQELEQQIIACKKYCEGKGFEVIDIFTDVASGADFMKRPGYFQMLKHLRAMKYDAVVVFKLDRIGRDLEEMLSFFREMDNKNIIIDSMGENIDRNSAAGTLMHNIILSFAQFEREKISEATKERLAIKKAAGWKPGRPIGSKDTKKRKKRRISEGKSK